MKHTFLYSLSFCIIFLFFYILLIFSIIFLFYTYFFSVFDEGRLSDSHGRVADFRNTVIIMTSNLGQQQLRELRKSNEEKEKSSRNFSQASSSASIGENMRIGEEEVDKALQEKDNKYNIMKNNIENLNNDNNNNDNNNNIENNEEIINNLTLELVNKYFSLEFVNRIDEVIMFNPLSLESVQSICKVQISKVKTLLSARGE